MNRGRHARDVRAQAVDLINAQNRRIEVLGIEPELVLVLESNRQVKPEDVESAGLQILELRSDKVLVAFASDPELSLDPPAEFWLGPLRHQRAGNDLGPVPGVGFLPLACSAACPVHGRGWVAGGWPLGP